MFGRKKAAVLEPVPTDHVCAYGEWSQITFGKWDDDFFQVRYCTDKRCNQQDSRKADWDHRPEREDHTCRMKPWSKPWKSHWNNWHQSRRCIDCGMADVRKAH